MLLPRCGTNVLHYKIPYVSLIAATRQHQLSDVFKFSLLSNGDTNLGIKDIIPQPQSFIQVSINTVNIQMYHVNYQYHFCTRIWFLN